MRRVLLASAVPWELEPVQPQAPAVEPKKRRSRRTPHPYAIAVTVLEACAMAGISRSKLYLLMHDQTVKSVRIGGRRLVIVASLRALLTPAGAAD